MINTCPRCKGIIGDVTICPKCGVNILDYKEGLENGQLETPNNDDVNPIPINGNISTQPTQANFVSVATLVKCPACGRDRVADSAVACPECGFAVKQYFDKIKLEEKQKAQIAAQSAMLKQRQEENEKRKADIKKKLFGSRPKKAIWISAFCVVLGLCVLLGIYVHRENEISATMKSCHSYFGDLQARIDKLDKELEDCYFVSYREPTFLEKEQQESVKELIRYIDMYKRWLDSDYESNRRVAIYIDSLVALRTSYRSLEEYKQFLSNHYLIADTPDDES